MSQKNKQPTHNIYILPPKDAPPEEKAERWEYIGAGWVNKDGSLNLILDKDLPANTRFQVRKRRAKANANAA